MKILRYALALLFGLAAFLFWWLWHPEALSFQEQNQMFLFTSDYFMERITVAGGLACYLGEFLVQFYYYPALGAAVLAVVLVGILGLTTLALRSIEGREWTSFALGTLLASTMWGYMGDENVMLAFPVAYLMSLALYLLCRKAGWFAQVVASLPLYWLAGPAVVVQVIFALADEWRTRRWGRAAVRTLLHIAVVALWVYVCRTLWVAQYPWDTVLAGISYYRLTLMTLEAPADQWYLLGTPLVLLLWMWASTLRQQESDWKFALTTSVIVGVFTYSEFLTAFDPNTYAVLEQMYLVRRGDWQGIIYKTKAWQQQGVEVVSAPISTTSVNLALAKTGQMPERMFEFPQSGIQGMLMPWVRDNVSCVSTMEAFYELGFVNESLRYAFDLQESILNGNKSGRFTQRMAECNIVNGRYDVASKYIDQLKHTFFYRTWAEKAEACLYDEAKIARHPEWSRLRQCRLENDFLYYYPEMHKMLGQLVLTNRQNTMAYDYFMAALLLEGNYPSYVANLPQQPQEGEDPLPHGYRAYVEHMQQIAKKGKSADAVTGATSTR